MLWKEVLYICILWQLRTSMREGKFYFPSALAIRRIFPNFLLAPPPPTSPVAQRRPFAPPAIPLPFPTRPPNRPCPPPSLPTSRLPHFLPPSLPLTVEPSNPPLNCCHRPPNVPLRPLRCRIFSVQRPLPGACLPPMGKNLRLPVPCLRILRLTETPG